MKSFPNIKPSAFRKGGYVGYSADGRRWKITGKSGGWTAVAVAKAFPDINLIYNYKRLGDVSIKLAHIS